MTSARLILVCLILFNILLHIPFLTHPALDGETNYFYCTQAIVHNHLNPFTDCWGEKPPVMFIVPSLLMKLSPNIIWGRIESLVAASVALTYIYLIAELLYSPFVGLCAVTLTMFFPLFAVQTIFFQDPVPVTAAFMATLYYFLAKKKRGYLIAATLMVLTRESMTATAIVLFLYAGTHSLLNKKKKIQYLIRFNLYLLYPLIPFIIWLILNKVLVGYFVYPDNERLLMQNYPPIGTLFNTFVSYVESFINLANGSVVFTLAIALFIAFYFWRNKQNSRPENEAFCIFISLIVIYVLFHALIFNTFIRYVLFLYPLVFIIFATVIRKFYPAILCFVIIAAICVGYSVYQWQSITRARHIIYDTVDIRFIAKEQFFYKVIRQIHMYGKYNMIAVGSPISHYFLNPLFGYVASPFSNIIEIDSYDEMPNDSLIALLPRRQKVLMVTTYVPKYPFVTPIIDIKPDWPATVEDKIYLYEYYNPNVK